MKIKIFAIIFVVSLASLFYATPYLTLYQIERAYTNNNMADVFKHVNLASIQAQLKNELRLVSTAYTPEEQATQEMVLSIANNAIDQLTPENMSQALGMVKQFEKQLNIPSSSKNYFKNALHSSVSYQDFNTVSVVFYSSEFIFVSLPIILKRDGLFSWKISGIKLLPQDKFFENWVIEQKNEWMKKQQSESTSGSDSLSGSTSITTENLSQGDALNLSALNTQMEEELAIAKSQAPHKKNMIEQEQKAWQLRIETCPDQACMSAAYQKRISELKQLH